MLTLFSLIGIDNDAFSYTCGSKKYVFRQSILWSEITRKITNRFKQIVKIRVISVLKKK